MNMFGSRIKLTIFGESHGAAVGCVLEGLPAGFKPDLDAVRFELSRRAPRASAESTERRETDDFEVISGLYHGAADGTPLCAVFKNRDAKPGDYAETAARPSHADLAAFIKYSGHNDPRGGGMFSGRMTVPLVFAGAIAKQLLAKKGVVVESHISCVGDVRDAGFDPLMTEPVKLDPFFPLIDESKRHEMESLFHELRECGDSVGGTAECVILGVPAGAGEPFFNSVESTISHIVFSIPGVHAVEFGAGFKLSSMRGSEANDLILPGGKTARNNAGGVNGGIANGMPIIFRCAFRPVPSIGIEQDTIDLETGEAVKTAVKGRHDCCILPRGCAAVEAAAALAMADLLSENGGLHE